MWSASSSYNTTKEESIKNLRQLELEAYSLLVSALRAQGPLTQEKRRILKESGRLLHITMDRHKMEVRRAINDEKLNTIACHVQGPGIISPEDWCQEGRRVLPMLQRISPQTLRPILTDTFAGYSYQEVPSSFERTPLTAAESSDQSQEDSELATHLNDSVDNQQNEETLEEPPAKRKPVITNTNLYKHVSVSNSEKFKICSNKKFVNKNQKLMIVSGASTLTSNSILHKTLSVPVSKVGKLNLDKFKIVSSSSIPLSTDTTSSKYKITTNKAGKKVIPLSQLQMLNHKLGSKSAIKVLPITSKFFGKNITMTRINPGPELQNIISSALTSAREEQAQVVYQESEQEEKAHQEVDGNNEVEESLEVPVENGETQQENEGTEEEKVEDHNADPVENIQQDADLALEASNETENNNDVVEMDAKEEVEPEIIKSDTIQE